MSTTLSTKFINGVPVQTPNKVTKETKSYHISYNNRDISIYGSDTTALYINSTGQFLILNGNHTKNYKDLSTLDEHVKYFYSNINKVNPRSEHGKIFKYDGVNKAKYIKGGY